MSYEFRVATRSLVVTAWLDPVDLRHWVWSVSADGSETRGEAASEAAALEAGLRAAHVLATSAAEKWDEHARKMVELLRGMQ